MRGQKEFGGQELFVSKPADYNKGRGTTQRSNPRSVKTLDWAIDPHTADRETSARQASNQQSASRHLFARRDLMRAVSRRTGGADGVRPVQHDPGDRALPRQDAAGMYSSMLLPAGYLAASCVWPALVPSIRRVRSIRRGGGVDGKRLVILPSIPVPSPLPAPLSAAP